MSEEISIASSGEREMPMARRYRFLRVQTAAKVAIGLLVAIMLLAPLALLWVYLAEHRALPQMDGNLHAAGLLVPVTVKRDAHGVPHIQAANQADLFFAQGYVTAQDRLWQMDMFRRNANGELAEVLGSRLVEHDRMQRVLLIRQTAERVYRNLAEDERARLDDYARGVNAFIAASEQGGMLPAEFKLLHYQPRAWTGADSVSVGLMEVQELDMHAATKLERWHIRAKLNNPSLERDIYPVGSWRDHPPTGVDVDLSVPHAEPKAPDEEDEEDDSSEARNLPMQLSDSADAAEGWAALGRPQCAGCAVGSNNWVIAGKHTASGKPLLANDMHIRLTEPNIWYMAALSAPAFDAGGVTLPGVPYIVAGHNAHVAWGFTALYADVQDLYFEKLDGHGNYEGADAQWHPLQVDHETIRVRFGRDVTIDVQSTEHGPLVNALVHEGTPVALKWNVYDPALHSIPLYAMNIAQNWDEFSKALEDWCWPAQNLVYADDQGHIAYHAIGKVPIRQGGIADVPIADDSHAWQSYIPFSAMPGAFDPPSGFLATANSRVTTEQSPYPLTNEWIDPYRIERIYKTLGSGRDGLKPQDMLAMQMDIYSDVDQELGQRFAYAIDHTSGVDERLRKAADLMRSWDGKLKTDSAAASIVVKARAALWSLVLKPKLGALWQDYHWAESNFAEEEVIMHGRATWLPAGYKDWNALLTEAVREGMKSGQAPTDVQNWHYGDWHVVDIEHPLQMMLPLLGRIAGTGAKPMSGDTTTVKQTGSFIGPSQRFTMDWSDVDGSTENIVLGESGNPLSPYYRDQWKAWYEGTTFAMPFSPAALEKQTSHTLQLLP
jgi:penicillin amidase